LEEELLNDFDSQELLQLSEDEIVVDYSELLQENHTKIGQDQSVQVKSQLQQLTQVHQQMA